MPRYGLAVDRMSDVELWQRLAGHLSTSHLMARNRDPLAVRLLKLEEASAIVTELRGRGEQLPLSAEQVNETWLKAFEAGFEVGHLEGQRITAERRAEPSDDALGGY